MATVKQESAQLHDVLNKALHLLDDARALVEPAGIWPPQDTLGMLDRAKGELIRARGNLHAAWATAGGQARLAAAIQSVPGTEPAVESTGGLRHGAGRTRFVVRKTRDVNRLLLRALLPWKLPRIEVRLDALPPLEVQRAQDRITRIHDTSEQQILGPVAAGAVILAGSFRIVAFHNAWTSDQDLRDFERLFIFGFSAWCGGRALELLWSRARLLRMLLRLRRMSRR